MCIITQNREMMSMYRQRVAYGQDPKQVMEYLERLAKKREDTDRTHWLIRVQDGENFRNSRYPFWGVKRGHRGCIKTTVKKIKKGDILWFMTSKAHGGKLIGMSEYTCFYDEVDLKKEKWSKCC